ncbi:MAG: ring-cleaving dioxygenase [Vicinamibacterales bacterium]
MAPILSGIHHVTAIAGDPQRNLDFYTRVLGLRLVKLTVNFDDPGTYHFYFGDTAGSPGSILTFFPWPRARQGVVGNGQVSATAFAVSPDALAFWRGHLEGHGVSVQDAGERFNERVLTFTDPDGLPIELVGSRVAPAVHAWSHDAIPQEAAIAGFHSATISEEGYEKTAALLRDFMGLRVIGHEGSRFRYATAPNVAGGTIDVLCTPDGRAGRPGTGTVHHIAWRTPNDEHQQAWRARLVANGYKVSPVMDRVYFHSIYFREPGGVLFEIATDAPGFAVDETPERLGHRLMLPPWLETRRSAVEQTLPPLILPPPH